MLVRVRESMDGNENLDVSQVSQCMLQTKCNVDLGVDNSLVDVVMEDIGQLTGVTADLVAYLGDSAGEVGDALGGNIGHAGGMNSKILGSPLHLVALNLQGLNVESNLNKVVALGHRSQSADIGADVVHKDTALLPVLENSSSTAEKVARGRLRHRGMAEAGPLVIEWERWVDKWITYLVRLEE